MCEQSEVTSKLRATNDALDAAIGDAQIAFNAADAHLADRIDRTIRLMKVAQRDLEDIQCAAA